MKPDTDGFWPKAFLVNFFFALLKWTDKVF